MKVTSKGLVNGYYEDKYGKRGEIKDFSIPFKIEDAPEGTKSYAVYFVDRDAAPLCGFAWVHWLIANLKRDEVEENESKTATDFVQGTNSDYGLSGLKTKEEALGYAGFGPPNAPHEYELYVYALDTELELENGFFVNDLFRAMRGHVICHTVLRGWYKD